MQTLEVEVLSVDLAIIQVGTTTDRIPPEREVAFRWSAPSPAPLDQVWSLGYAYGSQYLRGRHHLLQRTFSGYVVAALDYELPGFDDRPFPALEISFQAPRGLSGAPLLAGSGRNLTDHVVAGVVIGNSATRMLVHESEHREESTSERTIIQHYESLSLGLAIRGSAVLATQSNLLGRSIGDYVASRGRLVG